VVERNRLIHQWLPSFDGNSVENCEAFGATLDEQNAKLLPEFEALRAIVTNLRECQRELARYLESDAVRAQLEKGITSAYQAVAADGDTAARRRHERAISLCARGAHHAASRRR